MNNKIAIKNISSGNFDKLDPKLKKSTIDYFNNLVKENEQLKDQLKNIDLKYDNAMHGLSNRCFVLTNGTMCLFCNIDCKFRKIAFRDESIDPLKLMDIHPSEVDEALKDGRLKRDETTSSSEYKFEI